MAKNEMWYVMDAAPDAGMYVGFKEELTREECRKHVEDGTLTDVLQRVPVKKGDVVGKIMVIEDDKVIMTIDATVSEDIDKASIVTIYIRDIIDMMKGLYK